MNIQKKEMTTFGPNLDNKTIAQIIVSKYKDNKSIRDMIVSDDYFSNENPQIEKKTRTYFDKDRKPHDNPNAYNAKIKSNFLRMLVQQKQDYAFAKTFILKLSTEKEEEVDLKEDEYGKAWTKFIDEVLYKLLYKLSGSAVKHGIGWCYVWIDENGELKLKDVPSNLIYPIWKDGQHTELDKLVYDYEVEEYNNIQPVIKEYAELWTDEERVLFEVTDGYKEVPLVQDENGNPIYAHLVSDDGESESWGRIPFVCFKATDDETPLLNFIKEQIDAYNEIDSKSVDGLIDDLDPMLVLKGISPNVSDLLEARELAKMTRTMSLDSDGDASYIQAQTQIESNLKEKQSLRSDIIKFGYGVDYEDARFGGNPNQLVIKSLYQNMDTYTDGLERHFQDFIDNLKYFFDKWYEMTGKGSFEEAQLYKVLVKLDRSMMINQSALIEDTVKLQGTGVSKRTLLEYNPVVQDVEMEEERLEEERKENTDNDLFNFAQRTNIENGGEYEPPEDKEKEDKENE